MSDQQSPAIVIPIEHQSSPKEHWMEKIIRKAAEEIENGQFKNNTDEYFNYGPEQAIAFHPRVAEALERFEQEVKEARTSQETIEKAQMYHELCEMACKADMWDGQGRWMGKDNEDMRIGEIMEPKVFLRRLNEACGGERVTMNRFAVMGRVALLVHDPEAAEQRIRAAPPAIDYNARIRAVEQITSPDHLRANMKRLEASFEAAERSQYIEPDYLKDKAQVATMQWPISSEWMVMRFNEYGVPTSAKYLGWRTALLSMITLRIITEEEAHKAFPVKQNAASIWYRAQLYHLRNKGKA